MNPSAKWAREHLAGATSRSDAELQDISEHAWRQFRVARFFSFAIGLVPILIFDERITASLFGPSATFWHSMLVVGVLGGLLGLVHQLVFQRYVRSYIRDIVDRN